MTKSELIHRIQTAMASVPGWCTWDKAQKLMDTIIAIQPKLVMEIGIFGGSSFMPQALTVQWLDCGVVHGIDPWSNNDCLEGMINDDNIKWWSNVDLAKICREFHMAIHRYDLDEYTKIIQDKAENVASWYQDSSIDMLHIDGSHSRDLAMRDATLWLPKVRPGGYIFFDDIDWTESGEFTTRPAIEYLKQSCREETVVNDCMVLVKS